MTSYVIPDARLAGAYLRHLQQTPEPARALVDELFGMPQQDQILALISLACRAPGSFTAALRDLPCLAGCDHERHEGQCTAGVVADGRDQVCPCDTLPADPIRYTVLTPAQELDDMVRRERAEEDRTDALACAAAERAS